MLVMQSITNANIHKFTLIDYLKILSFDIELIQRVYNNSLLVEYSMYQKQNRKYNEFKQATYTKEYKGIYFCFYVKDKELTKLEILFKPHYYFNNNIHNANDFKAIDCINILTEIKETFNLPVNELKILNIEFGLNAISPIPCKNLIEYTYYHEKNLFITSSDSLRYSKISYKHRDNGTANTYKMIKFYAKGLQFPQHIDSNTFRYEVKSKRTNYIKSLGISTYADLLKLKTYNTLAETLIKEFSKFLIIDLDSEMQNLNDKEKAKLKEYLNPIKWNRAIQGSRNNFSKNKIRYFKLLDKTENNIHTKLKVIIKNKLTELKKGVNNLTPLTKSKKGAILTINIIETCTPLINKTCIITGQDISMQKESSFLLSINQIRNLYCTDKKKFNEIKNKYLSKKWIGSDLETQIFEIYHNIRNKASNGRIKQNRLYSENQIQLFR